MKKFYKLGIGGKFFILIKGSYKIFIVNIIFYGEIFIFFIVKLGIRKEYLCLLFLVNIIVLRGFS